MTINYGLNRVRFPSPVPRGSRLRARYTVQEVTDVEGGVQELSRVTIEREGQEKPVCAEEVPPAPERLAWLQTPGARGCSSTRRRSLKGRSGRGFGSRTLATSSACSRSGELRRCLRQSSALR
jgi:hypothetical protein